MPGGAGWRNTGTSSASAARQIGSSAGSLRATAHVGPHREPDHTGQADGSLGLDRGRRRVLGGQLRQTDDALGSGGHGGGQGIVVGAAELRRPRRTAGGGAR